MKFLLFACILWATSSFGQISFQKTYGGPDMETGLSVQQTSDGGYISLGGTNSFGNGEQDMYLVKTDQYGNEQWSQTYGTSQMEFGISVKQTSDGGYILCGGWNGLSNDSLVLIKTDGTGSELWNYRFSGSIAREVGQSVFETADGGFVAVGFTGAFPTEDLFIVKTNSAGIEEWSHVYSGPGQEIGRVVRQTSDLGFFVFGSINDIGNGQNDYYLMRLDNLGDSVWTKKYGTPNDEEGWSMDINDDGGLILIGHENFNGGNIYVVKTDELGNIIWDEYYGGSGWDLGYSIKQTTNGGFVFSGRKDNTIIGGGNDMYCAKLDQFGTVVWEYEYPLGIMSDATSIEQTSDGGYIMVGTTTDTVGGAVNNDMVLLKIPATGILKVSVNSIPSIDISSFPNPFIEYTTLEINDPQNRPFDLRVYNDAGAIVFIQNKISDGHVRLDRDLFDRGLYHFDISIEGNIIGRGKIVAQ